MAQKLQSELPFNPKHYLLGRVALPPWVHDLRQRPFFYADDLSIANGTSGRLDIQIHDDAHFLVEGIHIISGDQTRSQDQATVQITDTTSGRTWSNDAIPLRDLAGKGDSPMYLNEPNLLRPTSTLAVQITNNIGSTAQFYVMLHGRKIYDMRKDQADFLTRRLWFQYRMNVASLAASAVDTVAALQVYADSDFFVKKLLSSQLINAVIGATGGAESQEVMLNLRDTVADVNLFSEKAAARLVFGMRAGEIFASNASWANGQPFCLKKPWLIRRNSVIEGRFDNRSTTAISSGFNLVFEGIRVFDA
jgi:hypothetical protein